jgi:hypothetical protein
MVMREQYITVTGLFCIQAALYTRNRDVVNWNSEIDLWIEHDVRIFNRVVAYLNEVGCVAAVNEYDIRNPGEEYAGIKGIQFIKKIGNRTIKVQIIQSSNIDRDINTMDIRANRLTFVHDRFTNGNIEIAGILADINFGVIIIDPHQPIDQWYFTCQRAKKLFDYGFTVVEMDPLVRCFNWSINNTRGLTPESIVESICEWNKSRPYDPEFPGFSYTLQYGQLHLIKAGRNSRDTRPMGTIRIDSHELKTNLARCSITNPILYIENEELDADNKNISVFSKFIIDDQFGFNIPNTQYINYFNLVLHFAMHVDTALAIRAIYGWNYYAKKRLVYLTNTHFPFFINSPADLQMRYRDTGELIAQQEINHLDYELAFNDQGTAPAAPVRLSINRTETIVDMITFDEDITIDQALEDPENIIIFADAPKPVNIFQFLINIFNKYTEADSNGTLHFRWNRDRDIYFDCQVTYNPDGSETINPNTGLPFHEMLPGKMFAAIRLSPTYLVPINDVYSAIDSYYETGQRFFMIQEPGRNEQNQLEFSTSLGSAAGDVNWIMANEWEAKNWRHPNEIDANQVSGLHCQDGSDQRIFRLAPVIPTMPIERKFFEEKGPPDFRRVIRDMLANQFSINLEVDNPDLVNRFRIEFRNIPTVIRNLDRQRRLYFDIYNSFRAEPVARRDADNLKLVDLINLIEDILTHVEMERANDVAVVRLENE